MLGALYFYGIQPGPRMVQENLDLIFTIIWSFAIANTIGAALCFGLSPALARLTWIPFAQLAPAIVVTIFFGAFQSSENFGDIYAMLGLGLLGWIMKQLGWPRAPFLVGFVLTKPTEQYLWLSISRYGLEWLLRPGVIFLGLLLLASIVWIALGKRSGKTSRARTRPRERFFWEKSRRPCSLFPFCLSQWRRCTRLAPFLTWPLSFPWRLRFLPFSWPSRNSFSSLRATREAPGLETRRKTKLAMGYFFSLLMYLLLILLFGFGIATAFFIFVFLYGWVKMRWLHALIYTGSVVGAAQLMSWLLGLYWPQGVLLGL